MAVKFDLPFTQTSHLVAFLCALLLAVAVSPVGHFQLSKGEVAADLVRLAHLASFATWLGVEVWVTFIAGMSTENYWIYLRETFFSPGGHNNLFTMIKLLILLE